MAKSLPRIEDAFRRETERSLQVAAATETLWLTAPPASEIRKQLKVPQLEALYESVYLRMFAAWENALEDLVVHFLAGYRSPSYIPHRVSSSQGRTLKACRQQLYGGKGYLLWHNPAKVTQRVQGVLVNCPVELVVDNARVEIERYAALRHRVAHDSEDTKIQFQEAVEELSGAKHKSVGRFLRAEDATDPLNPMKWLLVIRNRLVQFVNEMAA